MRAQRFGHGPAMAASESAGSLRAAGAAPAVADGAAPAGLNAQEESAPVAQTTQSREQDEHRNSAIGAGADKAFITLRVHPALKGYGLSRVCGDDGPVRFYVNRWGMVRELRDIAAVRAITEQVDANA